MDKDIVPMQLDFLLRYPALPNLVSPVDFMSNLSWGGIKVSGVIYSLVGSTRVFLLFDYRFCPNVGIQLHLYLFWVLIYE